MVAELTETFKADPMVTLPTSVPEQPLLDPVTVYDELLVGETVIEGPVPPVLHE